VTTTAAQDGEPGPDAADPLEVIRRHARAIDAALRAVDLAHPGAGSVTYRMRGTVDVLLLDAAELEYFTRPRRRDT